MGVPVLVIGASGSGKSRSLKNFDPSEIGVIKCVEKELPFRSQLKTITTFNYEKIIKVLVGSEAKSIVLDDAGYLLTNEFLFTKTTGYEKFTDIAKNFYNLILFIQSQLPREKIVYIMMHEDSDELGNVKPKTIGKLLDEKVCVEGLFTICLRCINHKFYTNNNGCSKTPEEMFDAEEIENDLKFVDGKIREYYNLGGKEIEEVR